jgi:glycosyltransferase involved in cell wall biosynthesis
MANPRALHIVLNGVTEDSRVLKCAWSLGNAGWDVIVCGAAPKLASDTFEIGYAKVIRVPLKPVFSYTVLAKLLRLARRVQRRIVEKFFGKAKPAVPNLKRSIELIRPIALEFKPDVIHAHDYTALPIAGSILETLIESGHHAKLVYDAHEYVPGVSHLTKPLANIYTEQEIAYVAKSAAVLSVSEGMSDLLIPHLKISKRPVLVANDPLVIGQQPAKRNLRQDCGLEAGVPILIYSGAVAPQRGIQTALEALKDLPGVHLVVVANPANQTVKDLQEKYANLSDRFHVQPYVPNSELVSYLSAATVGLIPILHKQNHEISLITKFGEYMQARLPILVSDVRTMSAEVSRLGNGEVFIAEDVADFIRAANLILMNPAKYSAVYTDAILRERTWELQAENLLRVYNEIANVKPVARTLKPFSISDPQAHQ